MADELGKLAFRPSSVAIFDAKTRWELFETPMSRACTEYAIPTVSLDVYIECRFPYIVFL